MAFIYLFRIQIVPILFSFHVSDTSHACLVTSTAGHNRPAGQKPRRQAPPDERRQKNMKLRNGSTHVLRRLYRNCLAVSPQEPFELYQQAQFCDRTQGLLGTYGPTLGLFQSLFSRILLSLKPSPLTSKILKTTSLKLLLSSIHKVSNVYWHQLCARNSAEHRISAVTDSTVRPARTQTWDNWF